MQQFVKKRIPVVGIQWQGERFAHPHPLSEKLHSVALRQELSPEPFYTAVLETDIGQQYIRSGDWILGPGAAGEHWALTPEVFEATYEPVSG